MATTTISQGRTNSEPGISTGRRRPDASGSPEFHPNALQARDPALFVAEDFRRSDQEIESDAFLLGMVDFLGAGRELGAGAAVDAHRFFRTQPTRVRTESMATLPPPTTATRWPRRTGVSESGFVGAHED